MTPEHHVLEPNPGSLGSKYGKRYALVVAPVELGRPTKTGHFDDHILVGCKTRPWLNQILYDFMHMRPEPCKNFLFPGLTLAKLEKVFVEAQKHWGPEYAASDIVLTPHVLRHSGPSNDHFQGKMTLDEIRLRGRWASMRSVARYQKHAKLLRSVRRVPERPF